jgi:hypothetical protein
MCTEGRSCKFHAFDALLTKPPPGGPTLPREHIRALRSDEEGCSRWTQSPQQRICLRRHLTVTQGWRSLLYQTLERVPQRSDTHLWIPLFRERLPPVTPPRDPDTFIPPAERSSGTSQGAIKVEESEFTPQAPVSEQSATLDRLTTVNPPPTMGIPPGGRTVLETGPA